MARRLLKALGWMTVATTTSITDAFTLAGLSALPALALSFPLGVFAPTLAGLAGIAVYVGAIQGRKQFTEGFVFERDEDVEPISKDDLAGLIAYTNLVLLLAGGVGGGVATVVPGFGLAAAAAYPVADMAAGRRRWYLSPASLLTTALSTAVGHGVEVATVLRKFHDSNGPLRQRIRPRKGA